MCTSLCFFWKLCAQIPQSHRCKQRGGEWKWKGTCRWRWSQGAESPTCNAEAHIHAELITEQPQHTFGKSSWFRSLLNDCTCGPRFKYGEMTQVITTAMTPYQGPVLAFSFWSLQDWALFLSYGLLEGKDPVSLISSCLVLTAWCISLSNIWINESGQSVLSSS